MGSGIVEVKVNLIFSRDQLKARVTCLLVLWWSGYLTILVLGGDPRTFNPFNDKRAIMFVEHSFDVGETRVELGKHPDLITESLTKKLKE